MNISLSLNGKNKERSVLKVANQQIIDAAKSKIISFFGDKIMIRNYFLLLLVTPIYFLFDVNSLMYWLVSAIFIVVVIHLFSIAVTDYESFHIDKKIMLIKKFEDLFSSIVLLYSGGMLAYSSVVIFNGCANASIDINFIVHLYLFIVSLYVFFYGLESCYQYESAYAALRYLPEHPEADKMSYGEHFLLVKKGNGMYNGESIDVNIDWFLRHKNNFSASAWAEFSAWAESH